MDDKIDTDALRQEFADYCVDVEPGIKARAPKINQLETLAVIAMTLFQTCKEYQVENAEQAARIASLEAQIAAVDGWKLVPVEPTMEMVVDGFESWPSRMFSEPEEWIAYEAMSGCQQAAHRARLCYAAMLAAAPSAALAQQEKP
jgi:hypothetical protein